MPGNPKFKTLEHELKYSAIFQKHSTILWKHSYILWITRTFYETLDILFDNIRAFHEMYECFRQTLDIFQKKVAALHPHFPLYRALTEEIPIKRQFLITHFWMNPNGFPEVWSYCFKGRNKKWSSSLLSKWINSRNKKTYLFFYTVWSL